MPNAYEEAWDVVAGADAGIINGHSGNNMFTYKYSHDSGVNLTVGYINAGTVTAVSYTDYGITYTGIDGLTLGYGEGDVESTAGTKTAENKMFAKYTIGAATVGMQISENNKESASDVETTGVGISYQVNDDLALSYGSNTVETVGSTDQEASAIGVSYTMGSLGLGLSMHQIDNIGHTATNDREGYQLTVAFAF